MNLNTAHIFRTVVFAVFLLACTHQAAARYEHRGFIPLADTTRPDTLRYPLQDRYGDPYTNRNNNYFDLSDTAFIKRRIEYDPVKKQYYMTEKIGSQYYRTPTTFSQEEFLRLQGQQDERDYFRKRSELLTDMNRRRFKPKFNVKNDWFNRIIGTGKIDIRPSGYVDILAGYMGQNIKNPTLPERARRNGGFDFNMNAQLQVDANIGDKLRLPISYNTMANFEFENQLNLNYQGKDDEIIKQFQLGNVNFTSKGTLIPSVQSLFGVKTQAQFGKLFVTGVLANQRAQRQSMQLQGGTASQLFSLKADDYEENRHFLMAHYFRNNYNTAMSRLPVVTSNIQILRVEVWVTNRTGIPTDTRDIVAFMDLGEGNPFTGPPGNPNALPNNNANQLYANITSNPNYRNSTQIQSVLTGTFGLTPVQDFEKTFARKLQSTEYYFNPQIGFLSLNQPLQADEVLGIAYQYTYNGKVYQVGEFSQDVPPDSTANSQKVLFLKLLKATSQRTNLPIWDLMMKNVYSVGYGQLERQDFTLDVLYEEPSLGEKRYLPPTDVLPQYEGQPIISLLNLDRLNNQNDPQPDGKFDYIEGFTVIPTMSRIVFPVLEPFGRDLEYVYGTQTLRDKYIYYPLYDTIKAIAQTYANLNRFKINGRSKTSSAGGGAGEYQLGFNIPRGSVTVTAGGQILQENVDYEINYDLGTLRVINQSILTSGVPVDIQYENQATFGLQQKNFLGLRLDYIANKNLSIGGTIVRLSERPFFIKQGYGDDPVRNTMYGVDLDYRKDVPRVTKFLNKLPFYNSNATSSLTAYAEGAVLKPGHAKQIGKGNEGVIYIDDFEGTRSNIDLRFPIINWTMASVPQMFPESALNNDLASGYNRAKIAWYNIEPVLQEKNNPNNPLANNLDELSKPETRQVLQREIFPNRSVDFGQGLLNTFDVAFYPGQKGPYNFETRPGRIDGNNRLINRTQAWGGLMRNIDQIDFETNNIEYIEFWMQDPFISNPSSAGGQLYFNLGNISEDVLKDGKRQYENGLPTPTNPDVRVDNNTVWGKVPANPMQVTNAFNINPEDRAFQDVGFDGLTDDEERAKFAAYLSSLPAGAAAAAQEDPSGDNFKPYRDASYDAAGAGILERYRSINNPHGNSPIATGNSQFINAFTQYPDAEELNRDNTLNEVEEYFQYKVDIKPFMTAGTNFITDVRSVTVPLANGTNRQETWYLFRIPVSSFESKVGNIPDFKSIRFIRMFATGFNDDQVVMRFGKLELVRNQWRKFQYQIDQSGNFVNLPTNDPAQVNTLAVNLEENDQRQPIRYVMPPGIDRQQQLSNNNVQLFLNEQALSLQLCNLLQGETRGVFKNMNLDMRQYGKLRMFIHAEGRNPGGGTGSDPLRDNDLTAVVRLGNDLQGNYYEIRVPLKKTPFGATDSLAIWPEANNLDFDLDELTQLKMRRNAQGANSSVYYRETNPDNGRSYAIIGNPNLGEVRSMLLSVENTNQEVACGEVWFNELRFSNLDEKGGWAALGRVDLRLADLGNISLSGAARSKGWGTLEQRVNERSREDVYNFDLAANIDAGKLMPKKFGMQIPVYAALSRTVSTPEYDPFDLDIKYKDKLNAAPDNTKDSLRNQAQDVVTIKTLNFTNVKKLKIDGKRPKIWSASNFDVTYSYISMQHHSPLIEHEEMRRTRAALGYNYAPQPRFIEPFKKLVKSTSRWLAFIKDFNINYVPSQLSFRADVFRQFGAVRPRNIGGGPYKIPETYDKYFTFDRYYILQWSFTRSLVFDYTATNFARVDEPFGRIDTGPKKDSVRSNLYKGGRNTNFTQQATLSYTLPTQKLPFLDWTQIRASYTASYNWLAGSLLATQYGNDLGNTISNTQTKNLNAELNFEQLYSKSRFLRAVAMDAQPRPKNNTNNNNQGRNNNANPPAVPQVDNGALPDSVVAKMTRKERKKYKRDLRRKVREQRRRDREARRNQPMEISGFARAGGRLLTSLKTVSLQYTEDMGTTLPGYMDSTQVLGTNLRNGNPGLGFIFGGQPDTSWINRFGNKGLLSTDTMMSAMIQQRYNQRMSLKAQISPIRDLTIDLNLDKTFSKQYSELYKDTSKVDNVGLTRLNPYAAGSFSVSYISYQTMFQKFDPNKVSETFRQFQDNRLILSNRLKGLNPYASGAGQDADGYWEGYGRYAQDVVIPAFLAAYTKKDPNSISLIKNDNPNMRSNPFRGILPRPNWTITYNGLSRMPGLDKLFSNVTLRHGYHSTLGMNSFNTALLFADRFRIGFPEFRDQNGNYIPYFLVPNITIQESFDPLIEIDVTFTNQLGTRFEYRKTRTLSLSLIDYQLAENRSTEVTFGFNWRKKGMPLIKNIKIGKNGMKLDNDVTFRFDFSLRDDATANSKLDQDQAFGTAGQKVIRIAPSIDYVLNNRISLKLYYEQNRNIPKISNAFPITNTRGGLQIRVSLAQ